MANVTHDLTIRLDEQNGRLLFFATRRTALAPSSKKEEPSFAVEIPLADLKGKSVASAERLIGSSVLGYFDHLTLGRLDLPKHYRDK
jgi:hypothetical protein